MICELCGSDKNVTKFKVEPKDEYVNCLLYTSPSPRD